VRFEQKRGMHKCKGKNDISRKRLPQSHLLKDEESRSDAKDVECYYCHKKCHYKRFCMVLKLYLLEKKKKKKVQKSVSVVNDNSNDNSEVSTDLLSVSSSTDSLIDSWVLDSGCSDHMYPNS
jgi:hypothetical protein